MVTAGRFKMLAAAVVALSAIVLAQDAGKFTDKRDGKTYKKVTIGKQVWMAENLNYDVPNVKTDVCYENKAENCVKHGRLYDWGTAMGIAASYNSSYWNGSDVKHRGVCPTGWHLPSDAEWTTLVNYVENAGGCSNCAGTKLKATSGWYNAYSYSNGTDNYGFSALPGGNGNSVGDFYAAGYYGYWWSATETGAGSAWGRIMNGGVEIVDRYYGNKTDLFSVRCVQD